jgi:hypothetical protein
VNGQREAKLGADADLRLNPKFSPMIFDDLVADRKAEARAFAHVFGRDTLARTSSGMPAPSSLTSICTSPSRAAVVMVIFPNSGMACAALLIKLSSTWLICDGLQRTCGKSPNAVTTSALFLIWFRAMLRVRVMQWCTSTSSMGALSTRLKSLSDDTSSLIRSRPSTVSPVSSTFFGRCLRSIPLSSVSACATARAYHAFFCAVSNCCHWRSSPKRPALFSKRVR